MCGICGFIDKKNSEVELNSFVEMMASQMIHRGPDEDGFFNHENVCLGVRRLRIIDLLTGQQPVYNEQHNIVAILNGEIYNYRELRKTLQKKGHTFRSASDTEVLVHAYEEYSDDFLKKLNGMFALCIYDLPRQRLLIARDRLGIKPLYYSSNDDFFAFASEMKPLLSLNRLDKKIDLTALEQYLTLEYSLAPRTVLSNIKKLLPGHYLVYSKGKLNIEQYWKLAYLPSILNRDEYRQRLKEILALSVKRQLVSDVPVGAFLSGGIDSSIIVALMSKYLDAPVKTFSIGFNEASYNELAYARKVAQTFGTEHYESFIDFDLAGLWDKFIDSLSEPLADVSIFPTYLVSQQAKAEVTVALSGDGGDELFGGYDAYQAQLLYQKFYRHLPGRWRKKKLIELCDRLPHTPNKKGIFNIIKRFVGGGLYPESWRHIRWMAYMDRMTRQGLLNPDHFGDKPQNDSNESIEALFSNYQDWDKINQMMLADINGYLAEDILAKVDRMSMAVSLETRVPFLDHEVVEFAMSIPGDFKMGLGSTKMILREAFSDILPRQIINRGKKGFSIPLKNWLRAELKEVMYDTLSPSMLDRISFFNSGHVVKMMDQHVSGSHNHAHILWALMVFALWHQKYMQG